MRTRFLLTIGLLVTVAMVAAACGGGEEPTLAPAVTAIPTLPTVVTTPTGEVVSIELNESPYTFDPADLTFETGKAYTLSFAAPGELHTFTINDVEIDVIIMAGETVEETIIFDQAGSFELICVPHQSSGMVGTVTVQ